MIAPTIPAAVATAAAINSRWPRVAVRVLASSMIISVLPPGLDGRRRQQVDDERPLIDKSNGSAASSQEPLHHVD